MKTGAQFIYQQHIEAIRIAGRALGYAIGVHGSIDRDIDLIAAPWVDDAADPMILVEAIRRIVRGLIHTAEPEKKPHGRLAWSIHVHDTYFDLSVLARKEA